VNGAPGLKLCAAVSITVFSFLEKDSHGNDALLLVDSKTMMKLNVGTRLAS